MIVIEIRKRETHFEEFQHSVCLLRQVLCSEHVTSALIGTINLDADGLLPRHVLFYLCIRSTDGIIKVVEETRKFLSSVLNRCGMAL